MSKIAVIHDFIWAYLATTCPIGRINHPCKRVFKSHTMQCIIRSLFVLPARRHVRRRNMTSGRLSLWPVSLKVFRRYSNLTENVSNNFKYPSLIYWVIMFVFATVGLLWAAQKPAVMLHFPSNLNHEKKIVKYYCNRLLLPVPPFLFKSIYLLGSALSVVHNVLMLITHLIKDELKIWLHHDFWWRTVWNDLM